MDRQKTKPLGHTMLRTKVAASAALLALTLTPAVAKADPGKAPITSDGVYVTILSPTPGSSYDGTKQVEVSAFYQASMNDGGVTTLELYIDGHEAAKKQLDSPEARGVVSFLIDPTVLAVGRHHIVVRAAASDAEVNSAATELSIDGDNSPLGSAGAIADTPPQLFIASPGPDTTVAGTVKIKVNAHDDSGKPPYVSLFIDHAFKTLRNYPPFTFDWDTTRVANGYHTIEVYGYNDAQLVGHAEPMRVLVNNPGGHTIVRHDLTDTVKAPPAVKALKVAHAVKAATPARSAARGTKSSTAGPLLAEAKTHWSAPELPSNAPLLDDNQIAQIAPEDTQGQLSNAVPQVAPAAAAPAKPVGAKKLTPARAASVKGSPALAGANGAAKSSSPLASPQNLASADTGTMPADGIDTQTLLSAPFIHPAPAAGAVAQPRASQSATATDAHSHGQPVLAGSNGAAAKGAVEMASASLSPGSISPSDLFDGSATLESPSLNQKELALPTHRVITNTVGDASHHLIPLFTGEATDPQVLARARGSYRMVFDTQPLSLDRPVQVHGSILFAPFRQIFESQGGVLFWLPNDRKIQAVSPEREIELTIGSKDALVNNQNLSLDQAPYLLYGRTMVPLSFLPVALDVSVSFDAATGHLIINSNK